MPTKTTKTSTKKKSWETSKNVLGDLKSLRSEYFSLSMKHAVRELKEVHLLKKARRAIARHLTQLHNSK